MIPYANLNYFLLIGLLLLPVAFMAWRGRAGGGLIIFATGVMLLLQYYPKQQITAHLHWPQLVALSVFGAYEWGLLKLAMAKRLPGGSLLGIPLALLPLAVAKFLPFFAPENEFGFVGISYVTFRALDLLWAVLDGAVARVAFTDYAVFLFFFPTLSSGPIDRYRRFGPEWRRSRDWRAFWSDLDAGVPHIMRGLLYKFVIATLLERTVLESTRAAPGFLGALSYAYVYSAYLFFDFAGYSAFAIGVSRWFGIHTPPNFNLPWAAQNIREFWNRWHMSLSFWFRDHVYSRFLISAVKGKWFKSRVTASNMGYVVSFGLMGFWHGLTWYYILYGFYHAALFIVFDAFTRWRKNHPDRLTGRIWKWTAHLVTIHAVVFGLWLFSGQAWHSAAADTNPNAPSAEVPPPADDPPNGQQ